MRDDPADGPSVAEQLALALTPAELRRFYDLLAAFADPGRRTGITSDPTPPRLADKEHAS